MNYRLFFIGASMVVLFGVDGFFLVDEEIVPPDAKTQVEQKQSDVLFGMQFTASAREGNLQKMGFATDEVTELLKKISVLEEKYKVKDPSQDLVTVRIEAASDPDALASAFCGTGATLPVRYAAMGFLVADKGGALKAVDFEEISALEYQEWAKSARVQAVYEDADLSKDRHDDAVRMALAATLARDEQTLLDHKSPFGRGLFSGWSWPDAQKKHPGIRQRVIDYAALMHLVLEVANREGGLCTS